jgi:tRNA pseudouridine(55) synthase
VSAELTHRFATATSPARRRIVAGQGRGISSNHALQAARRLYRAEKAGHTGTLDPLATGLLPLCFGEATKFSGELLDADKQYLATVQLGVTTDTADAEGAGAGNASRRCIVGRQAPC